MNDEFVGLVICFTFLIGLVSFAAYDTKHTYFPTQEQKIADLHSQLCKQKCLPNWGYTDGEHCVCSTAYKVVK